MKTQLTTLKRLTLAGALAATMSIGLLGGQPVGTALASDAFDVSESLALDALDVSESLASDALQAPGVIVQSLFGR